MNRRYSFLLLASLTIADAAHAQSGYPFAVAVEKESGGHRIVARNEGPAPVSVKVSLTMAVNATADQALPVFAVVPPNGGVLYLARVTTVLSGASASFKTESTWMLGDLNARPDGSPYRLPYPDGYQFRIGQSPGGPITTHTASDSRFAVDIPMPEGTPVVAARRGVVMATKVDQIDGAPDPRLSARANDVEILHPDGTIGLYAHLAPGGVRVYPGQKVEAGAVIGLAGSTGYSSGPHLHFAVQRVIKSGDALVRESLPFQFYVGEPAKSFSASFGLLAIADYSAGASSSVTQAVATAAVPLASQGMSIYLNVPQPILVALRWIEPWMWFAGIAGVVVLLVLASNRRNVRRRQAIHMLRRREPGP